MFFGTAEHDDMRHSTLAQPAATHMAPDTDKGLKSQSDKRNKTLNPKPRALRRAEDTPALSRLLTCGQPAATHTAPHTDLGSEVPGTRKGEGTPALRVQATAVPSAVGVSSHTAPEPDP